MINPNEDEPQAPAAPPVRQRRGAKRMAAHVEDLDDDLSLLREPLEQIAERSQQLAEIAEYQQRQVDEGSAGSTHTHTHTHLYT